RLAAGAETHSLIARGEETAAPQAREKRLVRVEGLGLRDQNHEGRQVLVLAPEAIAHPGSQAGPARLLAARLDECYGWVVIDGIGVHRLDDGDIIGDCGGARQELAQPRARLAVPAELKNGRGHR